MDKRGIISKLIGDILNTQTKGEYITVSELKTIEVNGSEEIIDVNTALVSDSLIHKIKSSSVDPCIHRRCVNYDKDFIYNPSFWMYLSKTSGLEKAEPLVVSWCSGNHTTFYLDQGFLSTYYLTPRLSNEEIIWDDLKKPCYDVVINKLVSEYNFKHSEAFVRIKKSYLEDYLYLRKKKAVQIFTIKKEISIDQEIAFLLNSKENFVEVAKQYEITIRKYLHKENKAHLEINGYKVLCQEDSEKVEQETSGHNWKGIEGIVTYSCARHKMPFEYVYVSDNVLEKYEADESYDVYPRTGSVSYRNQWSVSHCERVGRNAIKIELKKLYEGNDYDVIDYWNKFSIDQSEIVNGESIALKAEKLARKYLVFGRLFTQLINRFGFNYAISDIISLNEEQIERTGWHEFVDYISIAHHVNIKSFSKEQFVTRCKKLYILLGENLQEKPLRKIVGCLGFPLNETEKYRSIKLLDCIIKYLAVANQSGLDPFNQKEIIVQRVHELKEFNILSKLFALNNLRQLDAHKAGNHKSKLHDILKDFTIHPNSLSNNYADTCFLIYDGLDEMFSNLNSVLSH